MRADHWRVLNRRAPHSSPNAARLNRDVGGKGTGGQRGWVLGPGWDQWRWEELVTENEVFVDEWDVRESILGNQQKVSGLTNRKMELLFTGKGKTRKEKAWRVRSSGLNRYSWRS